MLISEMTTDRYHHPITLKQLLLTRLKINHNLFFWMKETTLKQHPSWNKCIILDYGITYMGQSRISIVFQQRLSKYKCSFWPPWMSTKIFCQRTILAPFSNRERKGILTSSILVISQCPFTLPLSLSVLLLEKDKKVKYLVFTTIKSNCHIRSLFNLTRPDIASLVCEFAVLAGHPTTWHLLGISLLLTSRWKSQGNTFMCCKVDREQWMCRQTALFLMCWFLINVEFQLVLPHPFLAAMMSRSLKRKR